jgi:hypothetical protein
MKGTNRWRTALSRLVPSAHDGGSEDHALAALGLATTWLNSRPLTAAELSGRVVLVDFWTYTCVNWLRTLPYRRAWLGKYGGYGLVLIGVHTPEFGFEHDLGNVRRAVEAIGVEHPVAVDNDYDIWTSFDNRYWPALYFIDANGQIRHHHFGEGEYEQSERMIQRLLAESGASGFSTDLVQVDPAGVEAAADWTDLWSPENYLGSERTQNFASPNGAVLGTVHTYVVPPKLPLNYWALAGDWTVTRQAVVLNKADGVISYRFHARDVNLVMAPATPGSRILFQLRIDGLPPAAAQGTDVDAEGNGVLDQPRLYQLVRQAGPITDHTFEIAFQEAGAQAFAFTFG